MKRSLLGLLALVALGRIARADVPSPAVDPADLPPLPTTIEEQSSSATVLAASSAEEDVVVGAAKREQSLGNVASAVTVISADRIRRFGYKTIAEAVAGVAGAYVEDTRIVANLGFRGINILGDFNTRILILVDGATVNEAWGSFAGISFGSLVSIDDIARIEVIRGPVSSVYGTNAFFGIINIVTKSANESAHEYVRTSINSIAGSVTTAGFARGDLKQQIRGSVQFADRIGETSTVPGIGDPGTQLKGDGSLTYAASLAGTYNGTFAQIRAFHYRRDSPFAPYNGDPTASSPYQEDNSQVLAEGGHTFELDKKTTMVVRGYANLYEFYDHIVQYQLPPFDDYGTAKTFGAEVRARRELLDNNKLGVTFGGEASESITESHSFQYFDPGVTVPKNFNIEGVYAEVDGQPNKYIGFTGGVRYDRNSVIDNRLSPRAALFISQPEQYGLKLLYAEGFRNPSAYEAFFHDDVSFAAPDHLHSETIRSFEGVLWWKPIPGLSTRFSAFYWDARDIVEQEPDADNPNLLQFQNVGRIVSQGFEVEASYRNSAGWYGFGGGAYSDVGVSEDPTMPVVFGNFVNAPRITAAGGISTPLIGGVVHASAEVTYISPRATRPEGDGIDSPAWTGVNLTLYAPAVAGFDVTAGVRNLIGTRDMMPAPGDYDRQASPNDVVVSRIPGEGRELFVKVGHAF